MNTVVIAKKSLLL